MDSADTYELKKRVEQSRGTWQCWWLSMLEVARESGKLKHTFNEGVLHTYFKDRTPPVQGELPKDIKEKNAKLKKDGSKDALKENLEVYGPIWQRMVMYFLWDVTKGTWYSSGQTINTQFRPDALKNMLKLLGVEGITIPSKGAKMTATEVSKTLGGLPAETYVLLDKVNKEGKQAHAMFGVIKKRMLQNPKKEVTQVDVYNQASGNSFTCKIAKDQSNLDYLATPKGFKINWLLPLTIAA
ncbi:hypothetical protein TWF694_007366 [Orbilia ellipsospora]|uniref:Uncharacterized protein n=1 Tax=Orbilia ellipsospora TaxID=2528407 RepID=A0AAV9XHY5_9PEZI